MACLTLAANLINVESVSCCADVVQSFGDHPDSVVDQDIGHLQAAPGLGFVSTIGLVSEMEGCISLN